MIPAGIYTAKAKNAKMTKTSDGVNFVEVELQILPYIETVHWRSPLTKGGIVKTFNSLLKMGAKMNLNETTNEVDDPLEGVGSKTFSVEIINIECDENEAPGSFKSFAKVIL